MRVLVTGANGQLGTELVNLYAGRDGDEVLGVDCRTSTSPIQPVAARSRLSHPTSPTAPPDSRGRGRKERRRRLRCERRRTRSSPKGAVTKGVLVQISTDYAFGDATSLYAEDAEPDPRSAYGRTKLPENSPCNRAADAQCAPRGCMWARGQQLRRNDVRLEVEHDTVDVDDQLGQLHLRRRPRRADRRAGTRAPQPDFHGTNSGTVSWNGFTRRSSTSSEPTQSASAR